MTFARFKNLAKALGTDKLFLTGLVFASVSGGTLWKNGPAQSAVTEQKLPLPPVAAAEGSFGAPVAAETLPDGRRRWIVDNNSGTPGAVARIMQAVLAAAPGDVIDVKMGTYQENLTLNKSITIRGATDAEGHPAVTIVAGATHTIYVDSDSAKVTLENLSIAQVQDPKPNEMNNMGIRLRAGELNGKNLVVHATKTVAVLLESGKMNLENAELSGYAGVQQSGGDLVCEKCTSNGNSQGGVALVNAQDGKSLPASAVLRHYVSKSNGGPGLFVQGVARVTLEDSEISSNNLGGIQVAGTAQLDVRRSTISQNTGSGLQATEKAVITVDGSTVTKNTTFGAVAGGASTITFKSSQVTANGSFGYASDATSQVISQNSSFAGNTQGEGFKIGTDGRVPASAPKK